MSTDIYLPQGANPLAPLRIQTARCARVDFDRAARSNVLVLDGDISQSRVQMPKEDRPLMSLQLPYPIIGFQLLCPSSGQLAIDLTLSQSAMSRLRVTAATFISKADVTDAKGMPHVKLPFSLPRNVWTQAVLNLPGIVSHLFQLPTPKWIDSIAISGSVRIRRIFGTHDESIALEKPSGMLLFTVPAYGPPVWKGVNRAAPSDVEVAAVSALQQQQQQHGQPFAMRFIRDETGEVRFTAARAGDVLQARVAPDDDADVPPEETDMEDEHGTHRSPRSEAVFQALQRGRQLPLPPDPAHQGRTGSAPPALLHGDEEDASHKASSYRRLVKAQPPTTSATKAPPVSSNPAPSAAADDQSVWGSVVLNGWDDAPTTSSTGTSPSLASAGEAPPLPPGRVATRGGAAGGGVANGAGRGGASPSAPIATVSKKPVAGRGIGNQQRVSPPPVATPSDTGLDLLVKRADAGPAVAEYTFKPKQERVVGYGVGDLEVQHSSGTGSGSDDESDASDDDDDDDDDNT